MFYENTIELLKGDLSLGLWLYYMSPLDFLIVVAVLFIVSAGIITLGERWSK